MRSIAEIVTLPTRPTDPDTASNTATLAKLREQHERILGLFREGWAGTHESLRREYTRRYGRKSISPSGFRTRTHELVAAGLVRDTGLRRKTRAGRKSIVWGIVA